MESVSHRRLLEGGLLKAVSALAIPMFVSALLQNAQSLIDLFWVGRLGSEAVAALALSGTVLMLLFPVVMGTATGTVALVARAVGARSWDEASRVAGQSLTLALVLGAATGVAGWFATGALCTLMGVDAPVARLAGEYLHISFAGAFTMFVLFVGNSALQGAGNTVVPMFAMLLANALNLVLDPVMIFGLLGCPRMGVGGAALATVLSQAAACAVTVAYLAGGRAGLRTTADTWAPDRTISWRVLRIGMPGTAQMLARSLMTLVLFRIVAACGTAAAAGYGIGMRFHMIILMPAFVLGNAAATLVGQSLGAGLPDRARRAAWLATGIDAALMVLSALAMAWWAADLVRVFDATPEVVRVGEEYLHIVSPFYVFAALAIVLGRALNGAGCTVSTMVFTIASLWGLQVPLASFLARTFASPTQGVWWAMAAALTVHGLLTAAWFHTGRWTRATV